MLTRPTSGLPAGTQEPPPVLRVAPPDEDSWPKKNSDQTRRKALRNRVANSCSGWAFARPLAKTG